MAPFGERPETYNKQYRWVSDEGIVLDGVNVNGVGTEIDVAQFRHVCAVVIGVNSPSLTVKCQGSFKKLGDINFGAAKTSNNPWDYLAMYDYQDALIAPGDTGVVFSGTDDIRQFEINTNGIRSLNFEVSGFVAGRVTVLVYAVNNQ